MKAVIGVFIFCAWAWAAPTASPADPPTFFQCELINVAAPEAEKSRLLILLNVPIDALSFVKAGHEFEARFGVSVAVIDPDGFGVAERELEKKIRTSTYGETNAPLKYYFEAFEFDLLPGKYTATVTVTDHTNHRQASFSSEKILRDFSPAPPHLALSDLLITNQFETDSTGKPAIAAGFFQNRAAPGQALHFYLEINAPLDQAPLQVRQIIRDRQNKVWLDQKRDWSHQTQLEKLVLPIWTDQLPYGAYELEMQVQRGKRKQSVKQGFQIHWDGVPQTGLHMQQALMQARLVASTAERKALDSVLADSVLAAQSRALLAFWSRREDAAGVASHRAMTEFYQRVEFANEKFGGSREGWKTDPGKIFIQLGMPDVVEVDNNMPRMQRRQLWRYDRLRRQFLFVDHLGSGDFVLAQEMVK